ncbi:class I SAM-dependent rRNA methyltransferase, partial [bacterium]
MLRCSARCASGCPGNMSAMSVPEALPALRLRRGEDRRLRQGHPWVFSNEIDTRATPLSGVEAGRLVRVIDGREQVVGWGYANPNTLICARLLGRGEPPADLGPVLRSRLEAAMRLRERLGRSLHGRLVFGESDGLPGLVLDRYGDVFVGQIGTRGMEALREELTRAILDTFSPRTLWWKNDGGSRDLEGLPHERHVVGAELPERLEVRENGLDFEVPTDAAQKTGWFYDQSDNRAAVGRYVPPGARVLDVCSYAGAWAASLLAQGAATATCIDASQAALDTAAANLARHGRDARFLRGDAFDALKSLDAEGARFDVVVVDPPAFIK